ncbi:MAG TPA: DUF5916 domain-containing protein, partial [Longimicrobiales bacterium]|nr:DUF5916 domain-containing protein [Longimicrobiales bacterium]
KLSGKLRGWSIGVLDAVTVREHADYITEDGERGRAEVAPWSNFFAARGRRELRGGQSVVGGILTAIHRQLTDDALAERLRGSAYAGGIDFTHEWADREWSVSGFVSGSLIHGRPAVIVSAQRSSARYYHRPDADYLTIDSAAHSLRGWSGRIELEKEAGEHWRGDVSFSTISPGYETNDLGFQSRADEHSASFALEYVNEEPGRVFRNWNVEMRPRMEWNWGGDRLASTVDLEASSEWLNYWVTDLEFSHDFATLDDRLTRGGPLARRPARTTWSMSIESDSRLPLTLDFGIDHEFGAAGNSTEIDLELGFKPAPNWNLSVSPGWTRERSTAQFVTAITDSLARSTFGRRYVFADLDEQELGVSLRSNITFTPSLTLEVFARPFIGSGRFNTPKELSAPRTFDFLPYHEIGTVVQDGNELIIDPDALGPAESFELEDEDFTFHSLRGNAVLRWEWRPGSTLFLVWQQQREAEETLGDLRIGRDFKRIGQLKPQNVFMIKISYWFTP